jgi:hypothetical protein
MYAVVRAHPLCLSGRRAKSSANCQQRRDGFQPNKKKLVLKREKGNRKRKRKMPILSKAKKTKAKK